MSKSKKQNITVKSFIETLEEWGDYLCIDLDKTPMKFGIKKDNHSSYISEHKVKILTDGNGNVEINLILSHSNTPE